MDIPITAPVCALLADRLAECIEALKGWNFRLDGNSRLPAAVRELRRVVEQGFSAEDRLLQVGNAVRIALDYPRLCEALAKGTPEPVRETLRRSLRGALSDKGATPAHKARRSFA